MIYWSHMTIPVWTDSWNLHSILLCLLCSGMSSDTVSETKPTLSVLTQIPFLKSIAFVPSEHRCFWSRLNPAVRYIRSDQKTSNHVQFLLQEIYDVGTQPMPSAEDFSSLRPRHLVQQHNYLLRRHEQTLYALSVNPLSAVKGRRVRLRGNTPGWPSFGWCMDYTGFCWSDKCNISKETKSSVTALTLLYNPNLVRVFSNRHSRLNNYEQRPVQFPLAIWAFHQWYWMKRNDNPVGLSHIFSLPFLGPQEFQPLQHTRASGTCAVQHWSEIAPERNQPQNSHSWYTFPATGKGFQNW